MNFKLLTVVGMVWLSFGTQASGLKVYEDSIQDIESLKIKLERLEIQKKIQAVEIELNEGKAKLNNASVEKSINKPPRAVVKVELTNENVFDPKKVKLMYVVGSGSKVAAVLRHKDKTHTVKNGGYYKDWRVLIKDRKVTLVKGKDLVEL